MNDDSLVTSKPDEAEEHDVQPAAEKQFQFPEQPTNLVADGKIDGVRVGRRNGDSIPEKSDSEAETVVLSGKEEGQDQQSKKAIKLEEAGQAEAIIDHHPDSVGEVQRHEREGGREIEARNPSLKRKRVTLEHGNHENADGGNSSNLSSTVSSPVQEARSSKATDSASNRSRSSPPLDEIAQVQERRVSKPRSDVHVTRTARGDGKSDGSSEPVIGRKRRDTRSATHYDEPIGRSESPPSRSSKRTQSNQSNHLQSGVTKRRRAPAPLHVEHRKVDYTHPESDDDSSGHSHHHLQKPLSAQSNAISPAKMVSQKKNRDRNGRTLLARACQHGDLEEVEKWLKDRPQDINVPDNAGNTPFQIAALDGSAEVVQLLLDAKCDINCRNIDKDTPLIDAVENGNLEVVEMLLKAGLDPRQTNAFGKEPLDLVKADKDNADEIREALIASKKEKAFLRRPSEDYNRQHSTGSRDVDVATGSAPGASPVNSNRSPPPIGIGARRRTARSQPTDDALLWVNATPARLRDAAGKGEVTIVDHILKMRPQADTESVLAAARGGHDDVLNLMLAVAQLDPDPDPLMSAEYKPAYSTPMLAAIGRGNTDIIRLLLQQPDFNPTRQLYKNMTYYEIARERQGNDWQDEYNVLKKAYDDFKKNGGRRSNNNSPRKIRAKRADSTKVGVEPSSSPPHDARKSKTSGTLKEESSDERKGNFSHKGVARKQAEDSRKQSSPALASDLESGPLEHPKSNVKERKSVNDRGLLPSKRADGLKPKRRLMSGNDFKTDQDLRRRASLAADADGPRRKSGDSGSSRDSRPRRFSDASESISKVISEEQSKDKDEVGKKRHRLSISPHASKDDLVAGTDMRKKKRRVDSQGNAIDQDRGRSFRTGVPAVVANMIPSSSGMASPTKSQGTAPVAFMGSIVTSPTAKSPTDPQSHPAVSSPIYSIGRTLAQRQDQEGIDTHTRIATGNTGPEPMDQIVERKVIIAQSEAEETEAGMRRQAEVEQGEKLQSEAEEVERKARIAQEEEDLRLEKLRQSAEAERQIRLEKEQEERRLAKLKRDEEIQQQLMEQERLREDEQERRRWEIEERKNSRRMRMQEEEERQRLQSLPNGIRRAAELGPDEARNVKEITKWLPLCTVSAQELNPGCESSVADERWIANLQAAPLLAARDLNLSQYTAWTRFPATMSHRGSLWRQLRQRMSQAIPDPFLTPAEAVHLDEETKPKFFRMEHIFWIKLADFMDIVPRHQHLAGLHFRTREMVLHEFPFGKGGSWDRPAKAGAEGSVKQEAHSPTANMTNGFR